MTNPRSFFNGRASAIVLSLAFSCILGSAGLHAQSSGPYVDACTSQWVDEYNHFELTVCLYGTASGLTASTQVVDGDGWGHTPGSGASEKIYIGGTLVYTSPENRNQGNSSVTYNFTPQLNTVNTLTGTSDECYSSTNNYSTCTWGYDEQSLSVQATVTPSINLTTSNQSIASGGQVTFTASINSGFAGTITFYDGITPIYSGTISNNAVSFTTSSLATGSHTIYAYWPGNTTYSALTSNAVIQTVFLPGQILLPAAGVIASVAGNGITSYAGDNSYALSAEFNSPQSVAVDSSGNLYIADTHNQRIRKAISSTGMMSTNPIAGNGSAGYNGDNKAATTAELYYPSGVAVDSSGNVYIADSYNCRVRAVYASGRLPNISNPVSGYIYTVAGNGTCGYSGDSGSATSAELKYPTAVAVDSSGNIYIADGGNERIRKVTASSGAISTVAGNGTYGYNGDNRAATTAELYAPTAVAVDSSGNIYIADQSNYRIRKVTTGGTISTVAGNGTAGYNGDNQAATAAELNSPTGVAVDSSGNIYITDTNNYRVRKVTASTGNISTVAGNGTNGYSGDGGPAAGAEVSTTGGAAVDVGGNLYFADMGNVRIRAVGSSSRTTPTVSHWPTAGAITYGQTLASSTLSGGTASVGGSFVWTAPGTSPAAGMPYEGVMFVPSDQLHYNTVTDSMNVTVNPLTPTVSAWPTAGAITYGQTLASSTLSGGTASVGGSFVWTVPGASPAAGTPSEGVTFTPSSTNYAPVTGSITLTVNQAAPSIAVATSGTPSVSGTPVTFTASVPGGDTNTVTFYNGGASLGTRTPSGGMATLTTSSLPVGNDSITAQIAAGGNFSSATSSAIIQAVNSASPGIAVSTSGTPSNHGQSVTFTATVSGGCTGTVTFYDGGTGIGTGAVNGTTATFSTGS
ncbi:MAG: Ig-like domain repeat protein, partial [Terracidiphilus sp.]